MTVLFVSAAKAHHRLLLLNIPTGQSRCSGIILTTRAEQVTNIYLPPASMSFRTCADEMKRGVEVDIDSCVYSSIFAETKIYQSDSDGDTFCGNHHATESCIDALTPKLWMHWDSCLRQSYLESL